MTVRLLLRLLIGVAAGKVSLGAIHSRGRLLVAVLGGGDVVALGLGGVVRRVTSWSPMSWDKNGRNAESENPEPATRMLTADQSFFMPFSPKASRPWSQPWKNEDSTIPREP
jgi:hypothetical protein